MGAIFDTVQCLSNFYGIPITTLCVEITGSKGNLATWKKDNFRAEHIVAISKKFNVSTDFILSNNVEHGSMNQITQTNYVADFIPSNHIIAYIDILGTKQTIKNKDSTRKLIEAYNDVLGNNDAFLKNLQLYEEKNKDNFTPEKVNLKIFTDNILLYVPYSQDNFFWAFIKIVYYLTRIHLILLLKHNLLIRGGVSLGSLYADDKFVIGDGIERAYIIEEKRAKYPRIILDKFIIKKIKEDTHKEKTIYDEKLITTDFDGELFIDYLSKLKQNELDELENSILKTLSEMNKSNSDDGACSKWNWLLNYQASFQHNNRKVSTIVVSSNDNVPMPINNGNIRNNQQIFFGTNCNNVINEGMSLSNEEKNLLNIMRMCSNDKKQQLIDFAKKLL